MQSYLLNVNIPVSCGYPVNQTDDSSVKVKSYTDHPALEGTNITLSCPPGLLLKGPNISMCMRNGEWDPDPKKVECTGNNIIMDNHDNIVYDTLNCSECLIYQ